MKGNKTNHPKGTRKFLVPRKSLTERFWSKVDKTGNCWIWKAGKSNHGYGYIGNMGAHRVAWELAYGTIPESLDVLHKCDNPPCVRPDHLFIGTNGDNNRDCAQKGRTNNAGEHNGNAKLTLKQIREIRNSNLSRTELALLYNTSYFNIYKIAKNYRWKIV